MENVSVESKSSQSSLKDSELSCGSIRSSKHGERNSTSEISKADKNSLHFKSGHDPDNQKFHDTKVPNKIIANWKHACEKTKDKTKDLLKRWRTLPEIEAESILSSSSDQTQNPTETGWSEHIWTTWVERLSIDSKDFTDSQFIDQLTPMQSNKFSHFFTYLLDHDNDNLISEQDFTTLIERFRHFADWSVNSPEFNILREVERGFITTFLRDISNERLGFEVNNQVYLTKDGWLYKWCTLFTGSKNLNDFPIWLQVFSKVLFQVINRSGTGTISRQELNSFYSSVLCLSSADVDKILDLSYQAMTSNGDHPLTYNAYRLCFANYLLGRYPNGPGQHLLGAPPNDLTTAMFPVDYSALNAQPEDLEQYTPNQKTDRRSVIV